MKKNLLKGLMVTFGLAMTLALSGKTNAYAATQAQIDAAEEIALETVKTDAIATDDGHKVYKFNITDKGYFTVTLARNGAVTEDAVNWGWNFSVYKSGDIVNSIDSQERITTSQKSQTLAFAPGTYYIDVFNRSDNEYFAATNVNYDLKVEFVKADNWESEINSTSAEANAINVNTAYKGNLYKNDDIDWFKYTTNETGFHSITMSPDPDLADVSDLGWGWNYTIYKSDRVTEVTKGKVTAVTTSDRLALDKGDYYIKIDGNSTSYFSPKRNVYYFTLNYTPSPVASSSITTKKVKITKVKAGKKKATVMWKKLKGASGYVIFRSMKSAKKGFKKVATVSSNKTSYVNKKLKSKKKVYYKVRAYANVGGKKFYSKYSAVKKAKIK